ncbi:MAG: type II toxin-antitoxin system PemK/MazF family toxin [Candidatus Asgardarchaeia archaeon]
MQEINPGDIWLVSLKETQGHETKGNRPAVVIAIHVETELVMVIPLTSNLEAKRFSYTYEIKKTSENGLQCNSIAMIFQLRSLSTKRFLKKLGHIDATTMKRIKIMIKDYLNL